MPAQHSRKKHYPRPEHIVIGLHTYSVEWMSTSEWEAARYPDSKIGMHWPVRQAISIRVMDECKESYVAEILLHELLHAAWASTGMDGADMGAMKDEDREEYVVGMLSPPLLIIFRQNPELIDYLAKCDGDQVR